MSVLELALSIFILKADDLFIYTKSLLNTLFGLNGISFVIRQATYQKYHILP